MSSLFWVFRRFAVVAEILIHQNFKDSDSVYLRNTWNFGKKNNHFQKKMPGPIDILMSHVSLRVYIQSIHVQNSIFYQIYTNSTEKILKIWTVRVLKIWQEICSKNFMVVSKRRFNFGPFLAKNLFADFRSVAKIDYMFAYSKVK